MPALINNRYLLSEKIGKGSFADVYAGIDTFTNKSVAIKVENASQKTAKTQLENEHQVYLALSKHGHTAGFPRFHWYGEHNGLACLVVGMLGPDFARLVKATSKRRLPLDVVIKFAVQAIDRLEKLHSAGYLHRDLKPENLMTGARSTKHVYLLDFGLARSYIDSGGNHIPVTYNNNLVGAARYASANIHAGVKGSRRDDMESLGYIIVYFLKGKLPWQACLTSGKPKDQIFAEIGKMKANRDFAAVCASLPVEVPSFLQHVSSLAYTEVPAYAHYRRLFNDMAIRCRADLDSIHFDMESFLGQQNQQQQLRHHQHHRPQQQYQQQYQQHQQQQQQQGRSGSRKSSKKQGVSRSSKRRGAAGSRKQNAGQRYNSEGALATSAFSAASVVSSLSPTSAGCATSSRQYTSSSRGRQTHTLSPASASAHHGQFPIHHQPQQHLSSMSHGQSTNTRPDHTPPRYSHNASYTKSSPHHFDVNTSMAVSPIAQQFSNQGFATLRGASSSSSSAFPSQHPHRSAHQPIKTALQVQKQPGSDLNLQRQRQRSLKSRQASLQPEQHYPYATRPW
mmetsp:Transcript_30729/g.59942  ORF Transcript_30729/g.59942 Transcript_30729/m.59942 type:complete len:565 (+) Transcript_30729:33-1727(+)